MATTFSSLDPRHPYYSRTMSITQTYHLAHRARAKLSHEAGRSDHNLRLLVGHANLLDSLMVEIADAEREQQSWFNQSVRGAEYYQQMTYTDANDWAVQDDSDDDSDIEISDDDDDEDDIEMADAVSVKRLPTQHQLTRVASRRTPLPFEDIVEDDEEDDDELVLAKVPSYSTPPELDHDADTSEDEAMPPSPQQDALPFNAVAEDDDVVVPAAHPLQKHVDRYADGSLREPLY